MMVTRLLIFGFLGVFSQLTQAQCVPSNVLTDLGESEVLLCPLDGISDPVSFVSSDDGDVEYSFVLCDDADIIQFVLPTDLIDFDGFGEGTSRLYGVSHDGDLIAPSGQNIVQVSSTGSCALLSEDFVLIQREIPTIEDIGIPSGEDTLVLCTGDNNVDIIDLQVTEMTAGNLLFVLTDADNVIRETYNSLTFNADDLPTGFFELRGIAYSGQWLWSVGDTVLLDTATLSDDCFSLSSNSLWIDADNVNSGEIRAFPGGQEVYTCPDNDNPDWVTFEFVDTNLTGSTAWILTDTAGIIESILSVDSFDFENSPIGECLVYGVHYRGVLTAQVGQTIDETSLASSCADLSDEPIHIAKNIPQSPQIRGREGQLQVFACPGDDVSDRIQFASLNPPQGRLQLIITLPDGLVIGLPNSTSVDFENIGEGECRVHALSYTGELQIQIGTFLEPLSALSSDCYALSDTFVTVTKIAVDGGQIFSQGDSLDFTAICPDDAEQDTVFLASNSQSEANYTYFLTDEDGIILEELTQARLVPNLLPDGRYFCYGLSYLGDLTYEIGDSLSDSQGGLTQGIVSECGQLSTNALSIQKIPAVGGNISWDIDVDSLYFCPSAGNQNPNPTLSSQGAQGESYRWLLVDENNQIREILQDSNIVLSDLSLGSFSIWGLSYFGELLAQAGTPLLSSLATGCHQLSSNSIYLESNEASGGVISFADSSQSTNICVGDEIPDFVELLVSPDASLKYSFLLGNQSFEFIDILDEGTTNFESFAPGVYSVFGVSYSGTLDIAPGTDLQSGLSSSECLDVSDNFLILFLNGFEEHLLQSENGIGNVFLCEDGNLNREVTFNYENEGGSQALVFFDDQGVIVGIRDTTITSIPLTGGALFARSLHYNGTLSIEPADTLRDTTLLSTGCSRWSENTIQILTDTPMGDSISYPDGAVLRTACPSDGEPKVIPIDYQNSGGYTGTVLTTPDSIILFISTSDSIDIQNFPEGDYLLFGLTYTGELNVVVGQHITDVDQYSNDCWILGPNALRLVKETPIGGQLQANGGSGALRICAGDSLPDPVSLTTTNAQGTQYVYVLTDDQGNVIGINTQEAIDFEFASSGEFILRGLAYTGDLLLSIGQSVDSALISSDCFSWSDNTIEITVTEAQSADIFWLSGENTYYSCTTAPDSLPIQIAGGQGESELIVLVDENQVIVRFINLTDSDALAELGDGLYTAYHLFYSGDLLISEGTELAADLQWSTLCYALSTGGLQIQRSPLTSHNISYLGVQDTAQICASDMDSLNIDIAGNPGLDYAFLVINSNGNVLQVSGEPRVSIENFGTSIIGLVGLSYSGSLELSVGDNIINDDLSTGCSLVSDNRLWLDVRRPTVSGLSFEEGNSVREECVAGDTVMVDLQAMSSSDFDLRYIAVDAQQDTIINLSSVPQVSFTSSATAIDFYALSFEGSLLLDVGDMLTEGLAATGCFSFSDTAVTLEITRIEGGSISTSQGNVVERICLADQELDILTFELSETSDTWNTSYIVTDSEGRIVDFSSNQTILFSDDQGGNCRVYGVRHAASNLQINFGESLEESLLSDQCYSLTDNFVEIIKITDLQECMVSVEEVGADQLHVFPNPTEGLLTIQSSSLQPLRYTLIGSDGRQIQRGAIESSGLTVNLQQKGIYFLHVWGRDGEWFEKIIVH